MDGAQLGWVEGEILRDFERYPFCIDVDTLR